MPKINLAQETMRNQAVARRRKTIYVVSSVLVFLVVAIYAGGYFLTANVEAKVKNVNQRIASLEGELNKREPYGKEIKAFSNRLVNVKVVLKNHIRWSQVLTELERLVLPNVTIKSLKGGTEKNSVTVNVNAPTVEAAADLVVSLQDAVSSENVTYFNNVTASSLSAANINGEQTTANGFSTVLKLDVKPEAFKDNSGFETTSPTAEPVAAETAPTVVTDVPLTP